MNNKSKSRNDKTTVFSLFLLGFGSIIGVGWSSTLNNLIRCGGGAIPAAVGFGLATLAFIPIALCFSYLADALPLSGGATVYAKRAFGSGTAFVGGWFMVMSYTAILPFEAIAINDILGYIFPDLRSGRVLYTIMGEDIYLRTAVIGLIVGMGVAAVNMRGAKSGFAFQRISTMTLLLGSCICIFFCLLKADFSNLTEPAYAPMSGKAHTGLFTGIICMFAIAPQYFAGFDTIAQSAELCKGRSLGKTIIGALVSAGIFYVLVFISSGLAWPWTETVEMERPVLANLLLLAYPGILGRVLWYICIFATLGGLFGAWNGFFIASTRMIYGMAREGMLPELFLKKSRGRDVPIAACILCVAVMFAGPFLGAGVLDIICTLSSTGFVLSWGISCLSFIRLQKCDPLFSEMSSGFSKTVAIVAMVLCAAMVINCVLPFMPGFMGLSGLLALVLWSVLGFVFYRATIQKKLPR